MNSERIKKLQKFLQEEPDDPFILYALATEFFHQDLQKSEEYFDKLLSKNPDYLPAYYHAALLHLQLGDRAKTKQIYEQGIDLAKQQNDQLALRELRAAYDQMLEDEA